MDREQREQLLRASEAVLESMLRPGDVRISQLLIDLPESVIDCRAFVQYMEDLIENQHHSRYPWFLVKRAFLNFLKETCDEVMRGFEARRGQLFRAPRVIYFAALYNMIFQLVESFEEFPASWISICRVFCSPIPQDMVIEGFLMEIIGLLQVDEVVDLFHDHENNDNPEDQENLDVSENGDDSDAELAADDYDMEEVSEEEDDDAEGIDGGEQL